MSTDDPANVPRPKLIPLKKPIKKPKPGLSAEELAALLFEAKCYGLVRCGRRESTLYKPFVSSRATGLRGFAWFLARGYPEAVEYVREAVEARRQEMSLERLQGLQIKTNLWLFQSVPKELRTNRLRDEFIQCTTAECCRVLSEFREREEKWRQRQQQREEKWRQRQQ